MDAESWITSDEALDYGFATEQAEEEVQMSVTETQLLNLVMKNKELEKQLNKPKYEEALQNGWDAFFNNK